MFRNARNIEVFVLRYSFLRETVNIDQRILDRRVLIKGSRIFGFQILKSQI